MLWSQFQLNIVKLTQATISVVTLVFVPTNDSYEQLLIFFFHTPRASDDMVFIHSEMQCTTGNSFICAKPVTAMRSHYWCDYTVVWTQYGCLGSWAQLAINPSEKKDTVLFSHCDTSLARICLGWSRKWKSWPLWSLKKLWHFIKWLTKNRNLRPCVLRKSIWKNCILPSKITPVVSIAHNILLYYYSWLFSIAHEHC